MSDGIVNATFDEIVGRRKNYVDSAIYYMFKRIECKKGSLSVQASRFHYCGPRNNHGPYYSVEVGFPKPLPSGWEEWDEQYGNGQGGKVYAFVPVEKVREFINYLGGEIGSTNNTDTEERYCVCNGPEKEYIGFNSRMMICSICGKDKG